MISFQDEYPQFNGPGHTVTNEEPELWRALLKGKKPKKVGSIASGGEIPLLCFLPKASEVVAVDHAYRAILVVYIKALMLQTLGADKTKAFLEDGDKKTLGAIVSDLSKQLPDTLAAAYKKVSNSYDSGSSALLGSDLVSYRSTWHYATRNTLNAARRNLDKLSLVHGDIRDLDKYGPFDVLYISNAYEHTDRYSKRPSANIFLNLVKPGGWLLASRYNYNGSTLNGVLPLEHWKLVKEITGFRTTWVHAVYERLPSV